MLLLWLSCQPQWGSASMWKRLPPCPQSRHGDEWPIWLAFGFSLSVDRDHRRSTSLASTVLVNTVVTGALKSQGQECTGASAMAPLTNELKDCFNRQVARP